MQVQYDPTTQSQRHIGNVTLVVSSLLAEREDCVHSETYTKIYALSVYIALAFAVSAFVVVSVAICNACG